MKLK
jgi:hypothetical protein